MKRIVTTVVLAIICAVAATPAFAQEPSKVGLTLGFPSSLGLVIPVSDNVTLRPDLSFQRTTTDFEGQFTVVDSRTASSLAGGVSVLFYVTSVDKLRTYVSPRLAYSRAWSSDDAKGTAWIVTGSFGGEYSLSDRFAVFGEVGLAWARATSDSSSGLSTTRSTSWTTRSGIGGIIYF